MVFVVMLELVKEMFAIFVIVTLVMIMMIMINEL